MNTEIDKLFKFLSLLCIRLIGVGGADIALRKKEDNLLVDLPFKPTAVYGPTTALHDIGEVDFSMILRVTVTVKEQPSVRLTIQPKIRSWVWKPFEASETCTLGELVEYYETNVLEEANRQEVLHRIEKNE